MNDPVKCMNCGAVSYNEPGKTDLYCGGCYRASDSRLKEAIAEIKTTEYYDDWGGESGGKEQKRILGILDKWFPELKED